MEPSRVRNRRSLWPPVAIVAVCVLLGLSVPVSAAAVTLAWAQNTEADLAGYKVHIGTSPGAYTQSIDVGRVTSFTVPGLLAGETYYFTVTAYDIFANESGFSSQVSTTTPVAPPPGGTTPPSSGGGGTGGTTTPPTDPSPSLSKAGLLQQEGKQLFQQGRYRDAIRAHFKALRIYRGVSDPEYRARCLEDLGRAFEALGDFETAARKFQQANRIRQGG